jgi:MFS family permease
MPTTDAPRLSDPAATTGPWYRGLTGYHWFVLIVCSLGWAFDTLDQQLFNLARGPAITDLLGAGATKSAIDTTGRYATAIFIFGWATGGILFGMLGDRWGRAKTMLTAIVVYSAFTGLSALSTTWWDFSIYRFLTGLGVGGEFAAGVSLVAEIMPARSRPMALGVLQALSAVGNMGAACISLYLKPQAEIAGTQGWRLMFLVGVLPALLVVLIMRKIREPDSWLKAKADLAANPDSHAARKAMGSMREFFGDRRWRRNALIGITLATAGVMGLWGVGFWTPELVRTHVLGNETKEVQDWYASMGFLIQQAGGFLGMLTFSILTARIGRKPAFTAAILLGLASVVCVFGFMTDRDQIWWMCPLLGFATLMIFGGYSIYFPELFPTRLRATGTGFCYNAARYLTAGLLFLSATILGLFQAPAGSERAKEGLSELTVLGSLGSVDDPFRYAAIAVACIYLLGLVAILFAPETKDKPLPE